MTTIIYSHKTALSLLENGAARPCSKPYPAGRYIQCAHAQAQLRQNTALAIDIGEEPVEPVELLSPFRAHRTKTDSLIVHSYGTHALAKLWAVGKNQYTVSPELAFVQMASRLTLVKTIALGMEMCGTYRLIEGESGFAKRAQLTSTSKLKESLQAIPQTSCPKHAKQAIEYIADGAASPMEACAYMLLCLPGKLGGFGFGKPLLNHSVKIDGALRSVTSKGSYCYDMLWQDEGVAVEYDSATWHAGAEHGRQDGVRRNHSGYMGVAVLSAYYNDISEYRHSVVFAKQLARALGIRLRIRSRDFIENTMSLRCQMLNAKPFA